MRVFWLGRRIGVVFIFGLPMYVVSWLIISWRDIIPGGIASARPPFGGGVRSLGPVFEQSPVISGTSLNADDCVSLWFQWFSSVGREFGLVGVVGVRVSTSLGE